MARSQGRFEISALGEAGDMVLSANHLEVEYLLVKASGKHKKHAK